MSESDAALESNDDLPRVPNAPCCGARGVPESHGAGSAEFEPTSPPLGGEPSERLIDEILAGERDVVELARSLVSAEPRPFLPLTMDEDRSGPYELDGLDDHYLEDVRRGALLVLAGDYVSEAEWGEDLTEGFDRMDDYASDFDVLVERLSAHYGEPVEGAEELRCSDSGKAAHWRAGGSTLVLQVYSSYGDGDIELHLWLAAVAPA
ncbi:hypothetical protein ACIGXM_36650 [Kitasatospora sp. NPDC052896]|uniref:hypothetical protein n=1 Tax=Kitasatospora sp. NPDC052896 TaxID=3364061 RepID=UPI0037C6510D